MTMKLLRNLCIWVCSTTCLFGYIAQAVPLEYFDDHEFSYDMDTAQSKVKYDPRLLSQQLKDQHNYPQERAAPCYSGTNKYTHGQRVSREDPCEVCLCVDGEIFCWWKKCGNPKRRKFKLEKSAKVGKSKKDKTIDRQHKEQLHSKQKKKLEKKLRQQHWQQQQHHQLQQQQQHTAVRSKILTFPENLPSVLYYDYKTEDQHGLQQLQHGNHEKPPVSSSDGGGGGGVGGRNHAHTTISGAGTVISSREDDDEDGEGGDDASSPAVGVAGDPTSSEMKFGAKSHSAAEANKKISLQQTSTATITTTAAAAVAGAPASESFSNDQLKEDHLNTNNEFISGHPVSSVQMFNIDSTRHTTDVNRTASTITGTSSSSSPIIHSETTFMHSQSQEIDHDGILRGSGGASIGGTHGKYPSYNLDSHKYNSEQLKGGSSGTSFRSSFNDFSSEFNASAAIDLDLIMGHHSTHDAAIILEADSVANASSSSSLKHELGGSTSTNIMNTNNSNRDSSVSSTTMATSTTVNQEQECIVMGASYKIGAVLPQETGNCLQCVCIEGATKDDTPRVTCSPHNCPPLVLPDLFDATGY